MSSNNMLNEVLQQLRAGGSMPEELVEIFSEEAEEHMRSIYDGLDRLRVNSNDLEALSDVRRSSHTLKGAAGAVGFESVTRLSHRMEDLLDWLGDHEIGPNENQLVLLLATADQIADLNSDEFDFDEAAQSMVDLYDRYDKVMAALTTPAADATESVAEASDSPTDSAVAVADAEDFDLPEIDIAEIREQLTNGTVSPELAEIFAEEADEHLIYICEGLGKLSTNSSDTEALSIVRRSSHTLKGAAGAVGMMAMHKLAFRLEQLLDAVADKSMTPTDSHVVLLNDSAEALIDLGQGGFEVETMVSNLAEMHGRYELELAKIGVTGQVAEAVEVAEEVTSVAAAVAEPATEAEPETVADEAPAKPEKVAAKKGEQAKPEKPKVAAAPKQFLRVPLDRLDSLVSIVGEMVVNRSTISQKLTDFSDRLEEMTVALKRLRGVANDVETRYSVDALKTGSRRDHGQGVNRIKAALDGKPNGDLDSLEFDRYTDFHLLARSLSEATSDIAVIGSEFKNLHGDLDSLVNRQQRFNRDAQTGLMHIRMVPMGNIGSRLERTIRSVSNKLGKKVDLQISGENTELDKTVLEEITDPLLHLIRNALDHGIEVPEERVKAGKPERSTLRIEALNQGTQVTIRVIDDGRGFNSEKIRAKALSRGLIKDDHKLSEAEIQSLIFTPGFSTADSLTDVSGRGVGMDVVRDAVQRLKGSISVDSNPGVGSTFTIHLPTSLAVSTALLVEAGGNDFAIPMQSVTQIMRLDPANVTRVGDKPMLSVGDRMVVLKDLSNHMEIRTEQETFEQNKAMLLVRTGDDEVAITIDSINGGQDIVVKDAWRSPAKRTRIPRCDRQW